MIFNIAEYFALWAFSKAKIESELTGLYLAPNSVFSQTLFSAILFRREQNTHFDSRQQGRHDGSQAGLHLTARGILRQASHPTASVFHGDQIHQKRHLRQVGDDGSFPVSSSSFIFVTL